MSPAANTPIEIVDPPVVVGRDEALLVVGHPAEPATFHPRQADHPVRGNASPGSDGQHAALAVEADGMGAGDELYVALFEEIGDGVAHASSEDDQRRLLRGDDGEPGAPRCERFPFLPSGGEECQLVERQAPGVTGGHREDQVSEVSGAKRANHEFGIELVRQPPEHRRAGHRPEVLHARRDDEVVVEAPLLVKGGRVATLAINRFEARPGVRESTALGDLLQVVAQDVGGAVGLADREGSVDEVSPRSADLDLDPIAGQVPQGKRGLQDRPPLRPLSGHRALIGPAPGRAESSAKNGVRYRPTSLPCSSPPQGASSVAVDVSPWPPARWPG